MLEEFHRVGGVPVNSCLLVADAETARNFPRGDLQLSVCHACGFVTNTAFDPALSIYSQDYEETQAFSPRFQQFIAGLAQRWVDAYDLTGKRVVEIGCGKGEFLVQMVRTGVGEGTGIDPGVKPDRIPDDVSHRLTWVEGFFPGDHPALDADAVICRHTLEHIGPVREFLLSVRAAIGNRRDTAVLFELPGTMHVLNEAWFWDVYYEHCSYFTAGSLARLFRSTGFEVLELWPAYDGQYIVCEARPSTIPVSGEPLAEEELPAEVVSAARHFAHAYEATLAGWRQRIRTVADAGGRTVIWGSGSKGVAFLVTLGADADSVAAAVDINPFKTGCWMAGTGHRIVAPHQLVDLQPDFVIAMNETYLVEIGRDLAGLGIQPLLESL
jgi:hypothetical protein